MRFRLFQVRSLRRVLIGLMAVVVLAVLVNYLQSWRRRSAMVKPQRQILASDLLRSASNIDHEEWENGVLKFRVIARKLIETRKGVELLEGIQANDYNPDGSERNHIRSLRGEYDSGHKLIDFSGDVHLLLGSDMEVRTEKLHYSIEERTGYSDERVEFASPQATGSASGIRYDEAQGRIELLHDLDLTAHRAALRSGLPSGVEDYHITAESGEYSEDEHRMHLQGSARLESAEGTLLGDRIEGLFSPDKRHLTSLACDGAARYESGKGPDLRTIRGDHIDLGIGPDSGTPEHVHVLGKAELEQKSGHGDQRLTAAEIDMSLDPASGLPTGIQSRRSVMFQYARENGTTDVGGEWLEVAFLPGGSAPESLHVRDHASMTIPSGAASPYDLQAQDIRLLFRDIEGRSTPKELRAEGGVRWKLPARSANESDQSLAASSLVMQYSDRGDFLQSGIASGPATLTAVPRPGAGGAESRSLQSDRMEFQFFPGSNRLRSLAGYDHVQVLFGKPAEAGAASASQQFRTSSSKIFVQFREDGTADTITQSGGFTFADGIRTARAGDCAYSAAGQKLVLTDHPSVSDQESDTSGDRIEYDRTGKVLLVRGGVRSVFKSAATGSQGLLTASSGNSSPAIVTADELQYATEAGNAQYTGKVQLLAADSQLQAQSLLIGSGGERVEAHGDVRHLISSFGNSPRTTPALPAGIAGAERKQSTGGSALVRCSRLEYASSAGSIHYSETVSLDTDTARLRSDSLDLFLDDRGMKMERAKAWGSPLVITQTAREVKGEEADYDLNSGKFVVIGKVELYEYLSGVKSGRVSRFTGSQLTFFAASDSIQLVR